MKKTKILYCIFSGLFGAFMLFSAVPDIMLVPEAVTFMQHLGYPNYFTVFIGIAKTLGVIAILIPGFFRIKEWAYAGLFFDLTGAVYSIISTDGFGTQLSFFLFPFAFGILSYVYYHKLTTAKNYSTLKI